MGIGCAVDRRSPRTVTGSGPGIGRLKSPGPWRSLSYPSPCFGGSQCRRFLTTSQFNTPATLRSVYNLPATGGSGAIAIVDAYHFPTALADFNSFST